MFQYDEEKTHQLNLYLHTLPIKKKHQRLNKTNKNKYLRAACEKQSEVAKEIIFTLASWTTVIADKATTSAAKSCVQEQWHTQNKKGVCLANGRNNIVNVCFQGL